MYLFHLQNVRFVRVLRTRDRIVRPKRQFIHSLLPVLGLIHPLSRNATMAAKKQKLTYLNFGRFRHTWIFEGDRLVKATVELLCNPPDLNEQSARYWRRAAKLFERAADFYGRAGLGIMAIAAWSSAAKCYESLTLSDDQERCQWRSSSIPIYDEERA